MDETGVLEETIEVETIKINRQEFLNLAWLASLGFLVVNISGVSILFSFPRFKEGEFGGTITFGPVSDLPVRGSTPLNLSKVKLWLSRTEEGLSALYKICPHLGCIFGWNDQQEVFICPCHGSQFQHDGRFILGPAPRGLDQFVIKIVDPDSGDVLAETPDKGGAVELPNNPDALVMIDTGKKILGQVHE